MAVAIQLPKIQQPENLKGDSNNYLPAGTAVFFPIIFNNFQHFIYTESIIGGFLK